MPPFSKLFKYFGFAFVLTKTVLNCHLVWKCKTWLLIFSKCKCHIKAHILSQNFHSNQINGMNIFEHSCHSELSLSINNYVLFQFLHNSSEIVLKNFKPKFSFSDSIRCQKAINILFVCFRLAPWITILTYVIKSMRDAKFRSFFDVLTHWHLSYQFYLWYVHENISGKKSIFVFVIINGNTQSVEFKQSKAKALAWTVAVSYLQRQKLAFTTFWYIVLWRKVDKSNKMKLSLIISTVVFGK